MTHFLTPYLLVEFGASQLGERGLNATWRLLRWSAVATSLTAIALLGLYPGMIFQGVEAGSRTFLPQWGPLFVPLVIVPQFAGLAAAMLALHEANVSAPTSRAAQPQAITFAGLAIYAGYVSGSQVTRSVLRMVEAEFTQRDVGYVLLFTALGGLCLYLAFRALRALRPEPAADARFLHALTLSCLTIPLVWGVAERLVLTSNFPAFDTTGLWRLLGVGVITYGIVRWRHYDLPQRVTRIGTRAGGAAVAGATGVVGYGLVELMMAGSSLPVFAGVVVAGAALVPAVRLTERVMVGVKLAPKMDGDALYAQRVDTYRAAIETSLARGTVDDDAAFLSGLRERFGITDEEDRLVVHYARQSVIVPRSGDTNGVYERLRLLGEGGSARVWLARERARDRLVVLKEPLQRWQIDERLRGMILSEARALARVRHPHIVRVEGVVEDGRAPVLVLEYLEGGSLADLLLKRGRMEWRAATRLAIDILGALQAAHAAGVIHRDVKPSNILFTAEGVAKLGDFGIALRTRSGQTALDLAAAPVAGTPAYMAPEALLAQGDARVDVYACAAVLHECVYGVPPGHPVKLLDIPPDLITAIRQGSSADPDERFRDAASFAKELRRLLLS